MTTRRFTPDYVSLAPTSRCPLHCAICPVERGGPTSLSAPRTIKFLQSCRKIGIKRLGVTGGEPFLVPDFLAQVLGAAARMDFSFDKIMTSAAWATDTAKVRSILAPIVAAGFNGRYCVSVDRFHQVPARRAALFVREAVAVTGRADICSLAYTNSSRTDGLGPVRHVGKLLGARLTGSLRKGTAFLLSDRYCLKLTYNHLSPVGDARPRSPGWDGKWFQEDWCTGPGQALFVNSRGEVKPCCGYANDLDALTIGNIRRHSAAELVRRARRHPFVGPLYRHGLSSFRDQALARDPKAFPGRTSDHCFFCWYLLSRQAPDLPA